MAEASGLKPMISRGFAVFACLSCAVGAAQADCMSLDEAMDKAVRMSPQVMASEAAVEQTRYILKSLESQSRPQLSGFVRSGLGDGSLSSAQLDNQYGLEVSYLLYDFGRSRLAQEGAIADIKAQQANQRARERLVIEELLNIIVRIEYARSLQQLYQQRLASLDARLLKADEQLEARTITRLDYTRLKSEAALVRLDLSDAAGEEENAAIALRRIFFNREVCVEPGDLDVFLLGHRVPTLEELLEQVEYDAQIEELYRRVEAADYEARSTSKENRPQVYVSGFKSQLYNEFTEDFQDRDRIGVQVSIPLYDGGTVKNNVGRLEARVDQLRAELMALEDQLRNAKMGSWTNFEVLGDNLVYLEGAVTSTEDFVDAVEQRFALQVATTDDILDAEKRLLDLQVRHLTTNSRRQIALIDLLDESVFGY